MRIATFNPRHAILSACYRALDPELQERLSLRCGTTVTLSPDHSPFISQPELLADIITSAAGRTVR